MNKAILLTIFRAVSGEILLRDKSGKTVFSENKCYKQGELVIGQDIIFKVVRVELTGHIQQVFVELDSEYGD